MRAAGVELDDLVLGDATTGAGLDEALDGVEVAYYLIHSMEGGDRLRRVELRQAETFAAAAARRRAADRLPRRPGPARRHAQPPPGVRLAVEQALLDAVPESVALRASIVVAARSRSFRFLVRLIERLPVLALPAWRRIAHNRSTGATCSSSWPPPQRCPRATPAAPGTSADRRRHELCAKCSNGSVTS